MKESREFIWQAQRKKRRVDPEPETLEPDEDIGQVLNKDPNREYVWAYKVGGAIGRYENMGYDIELHRPDGPHPMSQRKNKAVDSPIEWEDNVLMSIAKDERAKRDARGQRKADRLEAVIISPDGPTDPTRGIHKFQRGRTAVGLENTTTAASPDASL